MIVKFASKKGSWAKKSLMFKIISIVQKNRVLVRSCHEWQRQ